MAIIYKDESYKITGAMFEGYKEKGPGFYESVYHECLGLEFNLQAIPCTTKEKLKLSYKSIPLTQHFEPDFICYGKIILEIKALAQITNEHRAQVHNYLKATGIKLGLLANFGCTTELEYERIVRT
jgi:GxxExxY protein